MRKVSFLPWNPILLKPKSKQPTPHKHKIIATTNQPKPFRTHSPQPKYTNRTTTTPKPNPKTITCDATIIASLAPCYLFSALHLCHCTRPAEPPPSSYCTTTKLWSHNHHASYLSSEHDVMWFECCFYIVHVCGYIERKNLVEVFRGWGGGGAKKEEEQWIDGDGDGEGIEKDMVVHLESIILSECISTLHYF